MAVMELNVAFDIYFLASCYHCGYPNKASKFLFRIISHSNDGWF